MLKENSQAQKSAQRKTARPINVPKRRQLGPKKCPKKTARPINMPKRRQLGPEKVPKRRQPGP